jgi:hypothetical protein
MAEAARGGKKMTTETVRPGQGTIRGKRLPASFDEMTVEEFLDFVRWWAALSTTDRQALAAARKHTLH